MIDTVILLIPKHNVGFLKDVFSWDEFSKRESYKKYIRNPSKVEKETGKYYPRLTGYARRYGMDANLRLEFSVPKIVFRDNLNELSDDDFKLVIKTLQKRLEEMGIIVKREILETAPVSGVHFSKNIVLKDNFTASYVIGQLGKIDVSKVFDFTKARYINDGQSLCAHTTSHQLIIYDKVADLKKKKKRAIDKEQTDYQMDLFPKIKKRPSLREIVRIEIRLAKKQKINHLLPKFGYEKNPTFKDVFSSEMSQVIVQDYWNKLVINKNLFLFGISSSPKELLHLILLKNPGIKPKQALYLSGLITLAKDEDGIRQLRNYIDKVGNDRTWYRIKTDIVALNQMVELDDIRGWVKQIEEALKNYKPLRLKHYE